MAVNWLFNEKSNSKQCRKHETVTRLHVSASNKSTADPVPSNTSFKIPPHDLRCPQNLIINCALSLLYDSPFPWRKCLAQTETHNAFTIIDLHLFSIYLALVWSSLYPTHPILLQSSICQSSSLAFWVSWRTFKIHGIFLFHNMFFIVFILFKCSKHYRKVFLRTVHWLFGEPKMLLLMVKPPHLEALF